MKGSEAANAEAVMEQAEQDAIKKKATLESEYKKLIQDRHDLQKKIEESTKKVAENETDVAAKVKAVNDLTQKQADLSQQIAQNQLERQRVGSIRDQELAQLKSDLNPGGPMTKSEMLANTLANDSILQQAKQRLGGVKTEAERRYWQQIIDSQTKYDRQRFAGVLTPEELRAGAQKPGESDPNTEYLRRLADALAPPGES
jgi:chromosome segregation ATPase